MGWLGKSSVDKAVDIVGGAVSKGMDIWDDSSFSPEEKGKMFEKLANSMKSQATSISRRKLLKFIIAAMTLSFLLLVVYNQLGMKAQFDGVLAIVEELKIGWVTM